MAARQDNAIRSDRQEIKYTLPQQLDPNQYSPFSPLKSARLADRAAGVCEVWRTSKKPP